MALTASVPVVSSEFQRIARLTARFGAPPWPDLGIGDDAAVLHPRGALVATVDASVEDVHFRRSFAPLDVLCARALEVAASDVAAMGATFGGLGSGFLLSWSLPPSLDDDAFDALLEGARRAATRLGAPILGGNLTAGTVLALHTTALGILRGRSVRRRGASPGDTVYLSGPCGAASLGLRALLAQRERETLLAPFAARWCTPRARIDLADELSAQCTAAIDVSDGLLQDAGHLARASGVAIVLEPDRFPMLEGQPDAARHLGCDVFELALTGGEDYELLVTAREPLPASRWTAVGTVIPGEGVWVRQPDGKLVAYASGGWDHFAGRAVSHGTRT